MAFRIGLYIRACCLLLAALTSIDGAFSSSDKNKVFKPCSDTTVEKDDGFTFAFAVAANSSFYFNKVQLSPCDKRMTSLDSGRVAVFRPKVDEISLLVINYTNLSPQDYGGFGVAYAGSAFAAVSLPQFLANNSVRVTSLSLVMNFDMGRLMNLLWKNDKCQSCQGNTTFVCLGGEQCAIRASSCKELGGKVDCSLSIQLAFSGTDAKYNVLNSWYQLNSLHQYSLYVLYSNLKNSLMSQFQHLF